MQPNSNNRNKPNKHEKDKKNRKRWDKNSNICKTGVLDLYISRLSLNIVWINWCIRVFYDPTHPSWHTPKQCVWVCCSNGTQILKKYEKKA
jgi:hypothetical protein